ncbi:MAG: PocR ligand-binding domain-containing protein [Vallitaleaceae bacterium]|jgi:ligand-binding sensor protein|nr:PocR ligand-binding domain-containing protein [Vallitaleaceae bacterium]
MNILFNITDLKELLYDFYTLTGVRVVIFDNDFHEIVAYPTIHSDFCQLLRSDKQANDACRNCDYAACLTSKKNQHYYTYRCHVGLTETVVPINADGIVIGYIMFGQMLLTDNPNELWNKIKVTVQNYRIDMDALHNAFLEKDIISEDVLYSAARTMEISASYLYLSRKIRMTEDSLSYQINVFITENITNKLTVPVICEHFSISKSKLYEIADESFGMGIAKYIRYLRVLRAKVLLSKEDLLIYEVASQIGIDDYNYFTKIFKAETGLTPKSYRKEYSRTVNVSSKAT